MFPKDLSNLTIIPARLILVAEECVPDQPGVYLFFFRGGNKLLTATSYFDMGCRRPLSFRRRQHLYTGATFDLRRRLKQHMAIMEASSLRRSLLAVERQRKAISLSATTLKACAGPPAVLRRAKSLARISSHSRTGVRQILVERTGKTCRKRT